MSALPKTDFPAAMAGAGAERDAQRATELARIEQALRENPTDPAILLHAGALMREAGRTAEATRLLTRGTALASERPETTITMAEFLRGMGMHDDAVALLQQAIEKVPDAPVLWRAMARAKLDFSDLDNARKFFDRALQLDPNFHVCRLDRADFLRRRGRLAEAFADYEHLRQLAPRDPGILVRWGDTQALMGELAKARVAYTAAADLVKDPRPIIDRLQRIAMMAFPRPVARAALPPARASANPDARADRIALVFFHADLPNYIASPFEKPDYHAMLAQAIDVARRQAPRARIVLLTDENTRFSPNLTVDRIVRGSVDGAQLMFDRMRMERDFLASDDNAEGVVFLDSDVIVNRDPTEVFDGSFDVALTWRTELPDAPFNGGVALYRKGPAAIRFYDHLIAAHIALEQLPAVTKRFPEGEMRRWWGHQLAMAATIGWVDFARRRTDRLAIDGAAVRFLPEDDFNFAMDPALPIPQDLDRRFFIHFKGTRKSGLSRYVQIAHAPQQPAAAPTPASGASRPADIRRTPREVHVCVANHSPTGQKTLTDLLGCLWACFDEIGFKVTISASELRADVPNIVFEYHNDLYKPLLDRHRGKLNLICLVTEIIKADKFDDAGGSWDGARRFQDFLSITDHYTGFITTIPSNVELLRAVAPTTFFEFGYSDRLLTLSDWRNWRHDYLHTGALTPHRRKFLADVAGHITVTTPGDPKAHTAELLSSDDYVELIRRSAINICLKQHPKWEYPSGTRLSRIIHAGVGCAMEATDIQIRLSKYFPAFKDSADFLQRFTNLDREKIAADALDRLAQYRTELPMRREAERNIAECLPLVGLA